MRQSAAEFVVRAAEENDLEAIFALECASFDSDRLSRRALLRFLKSGRCPLMVARSSGRMIGYALVSLPPRARAARLYSIAVEAAQRRRGVGRELLHAAERYACAHGRTRLRLEVRYDNAPAIRFYEKQ